MKFWREHAALRIILMAATFVVGFALMIYGWTLTGKLKGLGIMLVGVALMLATLYLYNTRFADPHEKKTR